MKSVSLLVFLLCLSFASGFKCYKCISFKSWEDCANNRTVMYCPAGYDRCGKASLSFKQDGKQVQGFDKECVTEKRCDEWEKSDFCKDKECKLTCCSDDLCNAAAPLMASATIFISCAIMALAF